MDVVMLRADYERFLEIFDDLTRGGPYSRRLVSGRVGAMRFREGGRYQTKVEERYSEARYGSGVWWTSSPRLRPRKRSGQGVRRVREVRR